MRTLVSIQRVTALNPIEGADRIEVASVLGWKVIVKKGDFKVGDQAVYFEVDSFLPVDPRYEFLRKSCYRNLDGKEGFRIRTVKMKKQISQGLLLPLSQFPEIDPMLISLKSAMESLNDSPNTTVTFNLDITERLGVTKYEPLVREFSSIGKGEVKGAFPGCVPKTDETRIQAVPDVLERHKDQAWIVTEKVDGTSATFYHVDGYFGCCSRNLERKDTPEDLYWTMARKYNIEAGLRAKGNYAVQGEILGPGVQKNKYGLKENQLFVFNVYDISAGKYLNHTDMVQFCADLCLTTVPVLGRYAVPTNINNLVYYATRKSALADIWSEGLVFRPYIETYDRELGRLSFKVINPEFLLKYEGEE